MGLLKALVNDVRDVLADQWIEYFNCDALPENILMVKGTKYVTVKGQNRKGEDNVISDGARIDIADGQFMIIVENGQIVDYCAEPGQYTYRTDLQPSLLSGGFSAVGATFKEIGKRFVAGGQPTSKQVVYYFNTKEILNNKWGVGAVPFRDSEFNFTIKISAYDEYSYKIENPLLFYKNVCGNTIYTYTKDNIDAQLKAELQTALQPSLARVADLLIAVISVQNVEQEDLNLR